MGNKRLALAAGRPSGAQLWKELTESGNIILVFFSLHINENPASPLLACQAKSEIDLEIYLLGDGFFFILSSFSCLSAERSNGGR